MATTREKQEARLVAIDSISRLISAALVGNTISFPYLSNKYATEKSKELFRREVEGIQSQLFNRAYRLQEKVY